MQTKQLLCWSGMTDTEHTSPGSNEEEEGVSLFMSSQYTLNN